MNRNSRIRSWGAWSSTIALALFVLKIYFRVEVPQADDLVNLVFLCGLAWGIWNNPTNKEGF